MSNFYDTFTAHPLGSIADSIGRRFFTQPVSPDEAAIDAYAEQIIASALKRSLEPSEDYPRSEAAYFVVAWAIHNAANGPALERLLVEAIARRAPVAVRPEKQPHYVEQPAAFLDWIITYGADPAIIAGAFMRDIETERVTQRGDIRSRHLIEIAVHQALTARAAKEAAKK